ncbi:hypothetical protein [Streptomyces sp. NPDC001089]
MRTSDLVAQVASIVVAAVGMVIAWLVTRRFPEPAHIPGPTPGADAERPL